MKSTQTEKTATAARNAVQLSKQGPYAWGVERDGKLIAQGLSKGAAEALAKTAAASEKTPIERAKAALNGDSNDEEHDALLALVESLEANLNNAGKLAEALRELFKQCAMVHKYWGENCNQQESDAAVTQASEALARWESEAGK